MSLFSNFNQILDDSFSLIYIRTTTSVNDFAASRKFRVILFCKTIPEKSWTSCGAEIASEICFLVYSITLTVIKYMFGITAPWALADLYLGAKLPRADFHIFNTTLEVVPMKSFWIHSGLKLLANFGTQPALWLPAVHVACTENHSVTQSWFVPGSVLQLFQQRGLSLEQGTQGPCQQPCWGGSSQALNVPPLLAWREPVPPFTGPGAGHLCPVLLGWVTHQSLHPLQSGTEIQPYPE